MTRTLSLLAILAAISGAGCFSYPRPTNAEEAKTLLLEMEKGSVKGKGPITESSIQVDDVSYTDFYEVSEEKGSSREGKWTKTTYALRPIHYSRIRDVAVFDRALWRTALGWLLYLGLFWPSESTVHVFVHGDPRGKMVYVSPANAGMELTQIFPLYFFTPGYYQSRAKAYADAIAILTTRAQGGTSSGAPSAVKRAPRRRR